MEQIANFSTQAKARGESPVELVAGALQDESKFYGPVVTKYKKQMLAYNAKTPYGQASTYKLGFVPSNFGIPPLANTLGEFDPDMEEWEETEEIQLLFDKLYVALKSGVGLMREVPADASEAKSEKYAEQHK